MASFLQTLEAPDERLVRLHRHSSRLLVFGVLGVLSLAHPPLSWGGTGALRKLVQRLVTFGKRLKRPESAQQPASATERRYSLSAGLHIDHRVPHNLAEIRTEQDREIRGQLFGASLRRALSGKRSGCNLEYKGAIQRCFQVCDIEFPNPADLDEGRCPRQIEMSVYYGWVRGEPKRSKKMVGARINVVSTEGERIMRDRWVPTTDCGSLMKPFYAKAARDGGLCHLMDRWDWVGELERMEFVPNPW